MLRRKIKSLEFARRAGLVKALLFPLFFLSFSVWAEDDFELDEVVPISGNGASVVVDENETQILQPSPIPGGVQSPVVLDNLELKANASLVLNSYRSLVIRNLIAADGARRHDNGAIRAVHP